MIKKILISILLLNSISSYTTNHIQKQLKPSETKQENTQVQDFLKKFSISSSLKLATNNEYTYHPITYSTESYFNNQSLTYSIQPKLEIKYTDYITQNWKTILTSTIEKKSNWFNAKGEITNSIINLIAGTKPYLPSEIESQNSIDFSQTSITTMKKNNYSNNFFFRCQANINKSTNYKVTLGAAITKINYTPTSDKDISDDKLLSQYKDIATQKYDDKSNVKFNLDANTILNTTNGHEIILFGTTEIINTKNFKTSIHSSAQIQDLTLLGGWRFSKSNATPLQNNHQSNTFEGEIQYQLPYNMTTFGTIIYTMDSFSHDNISEIQLKHNKLDIFGTLAYKYKSISSQLSLGLQVNFNNKKNSADNSQSTTPQSKNNTNLVLQNDTYSVLPILKFEFALKY